MEVEQQSIIKVRSKDKRVLEFKQKVTEFSTVLKEFHEQNPSEEIELFQFEYEHLELIRKYLQITSYKLPNYKIPQPLPNNDLSKYVPQKDYQWIKELDYLQLKQVFDIVYFLDIEVLIDFCSAYVACMFKGKDLEEIYKEWNITQEMSPEIEEDLKLKNFFVFEENHQPTSYQGQQ